MIASLSLFRERERGLTALPISRCSLHFLRLFSVAGTLTTPSVPRFFPRYCRFILGLLYIARIERGSPSPRLLTPGSFWENDGREQHPSPGNCDRAGPERGLSAARGNVEAKLSRRQREPRRRRLRRALGAKGECCVAREETDNSRRQARRVLGGKGDWGRVLGTVRGRGGGRGALRSAASAIGGRRGPLGQRRSANASVHDHRHWRRGDGDRRAERAHQPG